MKGDKLGDMRNSKDKRGMRTRLAERDILCELGGLGGGGTNGKGQ